MRLGSASAEPVVSIDSAAAKTLAAIDFIFSPRTAFVTRSTLASPAGTSNPSLRGLAGGGRSSREQGRSKQRRPGERNCRHSGGRHGVAEEPGYSGNEEQPEDAAEALACPQRAKHGIGAKIPKLRFGNRQGDRDGRSAHQPLTHADTQDRQEDPELAGPENG